jgi:hypothetical protein
MSLRDEVCLQDYNNYRFCQYLRHGQAHRLDGPAELWRDGTFFWCQYNDLHRDDGPAHYTTIPAPKYLHFRRGVEYELEI